MRYRVDLCVDAFNRVAHGRETRKVFLYIECEDSHTDAENNGYCAINSRISAL